MSKILISGGSGLIGRHISKLLIESNHNVAWLSREGGSWNGIKKHIWDPNNGIIDESAFEGIDHIIHLAGSGIVDKRWTASYKKEIIDSRVKSCELIYKVVEKKSIKLKSFIGCSAIGFYGAKQSDNLVYETNLPGENFYSESCVFWEKSYESIKNLGIRTVIIRTGIVLSKNSGAYPKMALPFKLGIGAAIGSGKQNFPWIHIDDIARLFVYTLFNEQLDGIYNAVASEIINNKEFSKLLAKSLNRPFFIPALPSTVLKFVMGEGACVVTEGLKISNEKIKKEGFIFKFEKSKDALSDIAF